MRNKGTFNFAANFEPLIAGPIDARGVVSLYSDLINPSTWRDINDIVWVYKGMPVCVTNDPSTENNGFYYLYNSAYTDSSNWIKIGTTSTSSTKSYLTYFDSTAISSYTVLASTHHLGADFTVSIYESTGGAYEPFYPTIVVDAVGNLTLSWVPSSISGLTKILLFAVGQNSAIDNSVYATIDMLNMYFLESSIGSGFKWTAGKLDVSVTGDVTKAYVDGSFYTKTQIDSSFALKVDINSSLGLYVKKAGDTMSGGLILQNNLDVSGKTRIDGSVNINGSLLFTVPSPLYKSIRIGSRVLPNLINEGTASDGDVAIGYRSLENASTAGNNVAIGVMASALWPSNLIPMSTVAIGNNAHAGNGALWQSNHTVAIGFQALTFCDGSANTAVGSITGGYSYGNYNTIIGYRALHANNYAIRHNNTALGSQALGGNTVAYDGVVAIGYQAGYNNTTSNKLYISNSSTSTPLIYGDFSTNSVTINSSLYVLRIGNLLPPASSSDATNKWYVDTSLSAYATNASISSFKINYIDPSLNTKQNNLTFSNFLTKDISNNVTLTGESFIESTLRFIWPMGFTDPFNNYAYSIVQDSADNYYIGGAFTNWRGSVYNNIVGLNTNGTINSTFDVSTAFNNRVYKLLVDSNNKLLVGGNFSTYKASPAYRLIRLNLNGTPDASFNIGTGFDSTVWTMVLDASNRLYVGGYYGVFNSNTQRGLVRLNDDGTKDSSFDISSGFIITGDNANIWSLKIDSSGRIVVGGNFTSYQGSAQNYLIRLNIDGTKDTTFDISSGFNGQVYHVNIDSSGRILCGGAFSTYRGVLANRFIVLNPDGSPDTTFDISNGFTGSYVWNTKQVNDKYLLVGNFTAFNGVSQNRLIRLNNNGSKDTSFDVSNGFNATCYEIYRNQDNINLIGGRFTTYNQLQRTGIITLKDNAAEDTSTLSLLTDMIINQYGFTYRYDYSQLNVDNNRWLPDKQYVDNKIANVSIGNYYTKTEIDSSFALISLVATNVSVNAALSTINASLNNKLNTTGGIITGGVEIGSIASPVDVCIYNSLYVSSHTHIGGNLTVDGSLVYTNITSLDVSTTYIKLNTGLVGTPSPGLQSGIVVQRGSENPYIFVYDEDQQTFRIGISYQETSTHYNDVSTQAVATRQDSPINDALVYWNNSMNRFDTSSGISLNYLNTFATNSSVNLAFDTVNSSISRIDTSINEIYSIILDTSVLEIGNASTNGSWRLTIDTSGNLSVQKRIAGNWVEKGNFN